EGSVAALKASFWKHNVLEAAPELAFDATLDGTPARVLGTWFDCELATGDGAWRTGLSRLRPRWTVEGRWPREGADAGALGRDLARRLNAAPGGRVIVAARTGDTSARERWLVTGVVSAGGYADQEAWAPLERVQALAARRGQLDRVWLSALLRGNP